MAKVSWESFLAEVLPSVEGCADVTAINAIRAAAIDFCQRTRVWQAELDFPITIEANQAEYDLDPPDLESEIVTVPKRGVRYKGKELAGPTTHADLTRDQPGWQSATGTQPTTFIYDESQQVIRVVPVPTAEVIDALTVRVALKPTRTSENADQYLYDSWLDAIAAGALARLLILPNKAWTNFELAEFYRKRFEKYIGDGRARVMKGGGDLSLTVDPVSFGGID